MARYEYDGIVIGGGAAGLTAAKTARGFGKKVLIIEKEKLGGECTWTGCVPSKALIKVAQIARDVRNHAQFGLRSDVPINLNTTNVMEHVRSLVQKVYITHTPEQLQQLGIPVQFGSASLVDAHTVVVNGKQITARNIFITTGSSAFVPPLEGLAEVPYLTNATLFNLTTLPASLLILGGGTIGVEMASALQRLGVQVTIIEMQRSILAQEDEEMVHLVAQDLRNEGVKIAASMTAYKVEHRNGSVVVFARDASGTTHEFMGEKLLIAVGRKPNIEDLNLSAAGVEHTRRGIVVDAYMGTTAKNIYAAGDVAGPYLFSHMAWQQAVVAARNAYVPVFKKKISYDYVAWVTFCSPELAHAGLTEQEARAQFGDTITVYRQTFESLDRAKVDLATGLAKIIVTQNGNIVGAHIVGPRAGELIHELQLAKTWGYPLYALQKIIYVYPTYSELLWQAAKKSYLAKLEANPLIQLVRWLQSFTLNKE